MSNGTALVQRAEDTARSVSALSGSSETFEIAQRMAKALASSNIVPAAYQGNVANVMVAMEYAHRLGASVLAVMQNLDIIHGRPGLRSSFLMGTVNASGRFSPVRFRWQGAERTDSWGCRAVAVDRESGEECVGPLVTIQTAKDEGWYSKPGSKWKTIPELMLMYRAGAWWARVYAPELSLGLHTSDEIEDIGPAPTQRARALAAALDAPDAEPVLPLAEAEIIPASKPEPTAADLKAVAEAKRRAAQAFADAEPDGELPFGDPKPRRRAAQLEE